MDMACGDNGAGGTGEQALVLRVTKEENMLDNTSLLAAIAPAFPNSHFWNSSVA